MWMRLAKKTTLKPYSWTQEVEQLKRVDWLPLYRDGMVEQISSYDPTGGNEDGFAGKYSYIRKEGDNLVLAELEGPRGDSAYLDSDTYR